MADELRINERPDLESPVLISAFRGWNDGGQGASLAAGYLALLSRPFALRLGIGAEPLPNTSSRSIAEATALAAV